MNVLHVVFDDSEINLEELLWISCDLLCKSIEFSCHSIFDVIGEVRKL